MRMFHWKWNILKYICQFHCGILKYPTMKLTETFESVPFPLGTTKSITFQTKIKRCNSLQ